MIKFQLKYQNESEVIVESNQKQREAERKIERYKQAFEIYESNDLHFRQVLRINNPNHRDDENDKVWHPILGEIKFKNKGDQIFSEIQIQISV